MANEQQVRARGYQAAKVRIRAQAVRRRLNRNYAPTNRVRRAGVVSRRMVNIGGQMYPARLASANAQSVYVVNSGRPAAARYEETSVTGVLKTE